jgi:hypothetical protein
MDDFVCFERTIAQLFPCKCGLGPFLHDASCQSLKVPYIQKKLDEQGAEITRLKAEVERLRGISAEFIFGEENPEAYEGELSKARIKIADLRAQLAAASSAKKDLT